MYKGVEHTAIATPDPEKLAGWYEKTLNFPINFRYAANVFVKGPDGTMLEFIPSEGDPVRTTMKTPGVRHLAIKVDDIDAGVEDLEGKGIKFTSHVNMEGFRLAFFLDPEGNILHLVERQKPI